MFYEPGELTEMGRRSGTDTRDWPYWLIGGACMMLSVALFLVNTRHGIGIYVDSTRYMGISERPYDAPIYAWMLQFFAAMGLQLDVGAKTIGLVLAATNTALIWYLLMRATNRYAYALVGTLLIVVSPQFVTLHSSAMSEPPFLFFILATLVAFLRWLQTEDRFWLIICALALGLAALTRFTAPPLGAAIAVCILANPRQIKPRRVADATIFALVSGSVFLSWIVGSQMIAGRSIGRELSFYGNMGPEEWLTSLEALTAWILPDQVPFAARIAILAILLAAVAAAVLVQSRRTWKMAQSAKVVDAMLPSVLGLFFIFYLAFMVLSTSLEANLSLNGRYAFPIYVTTVLMVTIALAGRAGERGKLKLLRHGLVAAAIVVLATHTVRTAVRSEIAHREGTGYASLAWRNSPTMSAVGNLPDKAKLYSNGADAIAYVLGRPASFIPERVQLRTGTERQDRPFELQMEQLRNNMARQLSYVVIFDNLDWRFYLADEAVLSRRLGLKMVLDEPDGRIYEMPAQIEGE